MNVGSCGKDWRVRVGIRWWLPLAFAAVAATTAIAVAQMSSSRSESAFRDRAQALAAGNAFEAAIDLRGREATRSHVAAVAERRRLALFLFDERGELISSSRSRGVPLVRVPGQERAQAVTAALRGRRFIATDQTLRATVVAIPLTGDSARALLAYASHPDLAAELGIVHDEISRAAWLALLLGGSVGVLIATLIARRLRRIARAAAAIEGGDFETPLEPDFSDELGDLAATFDRMRNRLRTLFRRLESDRDRLEQLLERLQEGVIAVDEELRVEFANRRAHALVGPLERGAALPDPWSDNSLRAFATKLFARAAATETRVRADAESTYALTGVPALRGEVAIIVLRDLSDEERRERAEREFVANASHELRTPLTTIVGAVELLQGGAKDRRADRDRFLAHIEREATRLTTLTRALLMLARAQTREQQPRLATVEVRPLLEELAASTTARPGVALEVRCADDIGVLAEPDLLAQALQNLATNAAEHTERGAIVFEAHGNGDRRVQIEVRDSGPGVPESVRRRVFDRFYRPLRTSNEGFGLGLAIAREAIRAQGGTIEVTRAPEGGARVTIELGRSEL
jgi:two-component system sensor histidine kinase VicK